MLVSSSRSLPFPNARRSVVSSVRAAPSSTPSLGWDDRPVPECERSTSRSSFVDPEQLSTDELVSAVAGPRGRRRTDEEVVPGAGDHAAEEELRGLSWSDLEAEIRTRLELPISDDRGAWAVGAAAPTAYARATPSEPEQGDLPPCSGSDGVADENHAAQQYYPESEDHPHQQSHRRSADSTSAATGARTKRASPFPTFADDDSVQEEAALPRPTARPGRSGICAGSDLVRLAQALAYAAQITTKDRTTKRELLVVVLQKLARNTDLLSNEQLMRAIYACAKGRRFADTRSLNKSKTKVSAQNAQLLEFFLGETVERLTTIKAWQLVKILRVVSGIERVVRKERDFLELVSRQVLIHFANLDSEAIFFFIPLLATRTNLLQQKPECAELLDRKFRKKIFGWQSPELVLRAGYYLVLFDLLRGSTLAYAPGILSPVSILPSPHHYVGIKSIHPRRESCLWGVMGGRWRSGVLVWMGVMFTCCADDRGGRVWG